MGSRRRAFWSRLFGAAVALVALALGVASQASAEPTLVITADTTLTADSGPIIVAGAGVTLDCAGHQVTGTAIVGINVLANDATVTNCRVQGFDVGIQTSGDATRIVANVLTSNDQGIRLAGATNGTVSGNTATLNGSWGIIAAQDAVGNTIERNTANGNGVLGIVLNSSFGNVVTSNVAEGNGDSGIRLDGASSNTVSLNNANDNQRYGILDAPQGGGGNTIVGNTANNNSLIGIALNTTSGDLVSGNSANHNGETGVDSLLSSDNQILDNVAMHNGNLGFAFSSASGNTIAGNSATNNGIPGNGVGFNFNDSSNNTVSGNVAIHSGGVGFFVFFGSEFNVFTGNRACQSFFVDAADISTGAGNTWTNNAFCTSQGI
jgi:parallel beta-helix repeat protein